MIILLTFSEDDDGVPLNSFLFYLVDGIIPLVTSFCYQLRDHSSSSLTTESYSSLFTPQVLSVFKSINDAAAVSELNCCILRLIQDGKIEIGSSNHKIINISP